MKFKVLGVTAGRKNSNSEILLKEALLACKEQNVDAVIFSAPTYDLMPTATFSKFMHRNLSYESSFLEAIGAI